MTPDQLSALLTYISSIDGRHTPTLMAEAWNDVIGHLPYEDAKQAVREHYRYSTEWLKPAHIVTRVRAIRKERIAELERQIDGKIQIRRADHGTPAEEVARHRQLIDWIASGRMGVSEYCNYHGGTHVLAANARDRTGMVLSAARRGARALSGASNEGESIQHISRPAQGRTRE